FRSTRTAPDPPKPIFSQHDDVPERSAPIFKSPKHVRTPPPPSRKPASPRPQPEAPVPASTIRVTHASRRSQSPREPISPRLPPSPPPSILPPRMPRPRPRRRSLPRAEIRILIVQLLERAGTKGMSKRELLTAIGRTKTSAPTIQRALVELRDTYDGCITYFGKAKRWRLDAPLAMPLEAPRPDDRLAVQMAKAILDSMADVALRERIGSIVADIDDRVRRLVPGSELPIHNAVTATLTLGTRTDPDIFRRLATACRRKTVRIRHASPWGPKPNVARWKEIEPWALHMHDGAVYVRGWAIGAKAPAKFRLADIQALEEVDDTVARPRHPVPADVWGDEREGYGIDSDRPGVAVIRLRGAVARWVSTIIWHPSEQDVWLEEGELLARTIPYRSCRELARRLVSVIDGIDSIEPRALFDEVIGLCAHATKLSRTRKRKSHR
ncbi:MAG TPA: WYL domain-containing protein, partial [Nannocystaceae bacterium]|nr:WYL domain-containing protein [Nannocystaceae bacterium]